MDTTWIVSAIFVKPFQCCGVFNFLIRLCAIYTASSLNIAKVEYHGCSSESYQEGQDQLTYVTQKIGNKTHRIGLPHNFLNGSISGTLSWRQFATGRPSVVGCGGCKDRCE